MICLFHYVSSHVNNLHDSFILFSTEKNSLFEILERNKSFEILIENVNKGVFETCVSGLTHSKPVNINYTLICLMNMFAGSSGRAV